QEAKAALSVDPNSVEAVVLLAHAYYFRKLYDTAGVLLDRVLNSGVEVVKQRAQKDADLYYVYGLVFDKTNEPARATLAFETAVKLEPDHKNAMANLAVHYLHDSRYAEARDLCQRLTGALNMRTAATFTNLGSSLRGLSASEAAGNRNQLLTDAESAYKRAIDIDKNYAIAYYDLALLYMDAKPFPLGTGDMDELVRLDRAKTYFKEYRALPGADIALVDGRLEAIDKAVKKEIKARKKAEDAAKKKEKGGDDW
ncbi:MAG TPA: tetratricopeptide repeat protein, partial [Kofleriaceae bacterium]|nr:tetratricopeptide repeat protein [Kofleriaceae bacterium]